MILLVCGSECVGRLIERALGVRAGEVVAVESMAAAVEAVSTVCPEVVVSRCPAEDPDLCRSFLDACHQGGAKVICLAATDPNRLWCSSLSPDRQPLIVSTPCGEEELRAVVEQAREASYAPILFLGGVKVDRETGELQGKDGSVRLTPMELRLLQYLLRRRGAPVSRDELLQEVWGWPEGTGSSEVVRSHIRNLRAKLRQLNEGEEIIRTFSRRGYGIPEELEVH